MTYEQLLEKFPGVGKEAAQQMPDFIRFVRDLDPEALQWAKEVIRNHCYFKRRTYPGGTVYTYAECYEPETDTWIPMDPFPSANFPRKLLQALLVLHYRHPDTIQRIDSRLEADAEAVGVFL
jgi:hypothetical protein